jgi:hypothetical protein
MARTSANQSAPANQNYRRYSLEISAIFRPLERLDSLDTDSNHPQNDVVSIDGAHIREPISDQTNSVHIKSQNMAPISKYGSHLKI